MVYSQSKQEFISSSGSIMIWSQFRASSVSSQGGSLLSFDSILPIYGYNTHLGDYFCVCLSCWLKWKPADVRGMQPKDDIIVSNHSLPLSCSFSRQHSVVIVYSRSHSPEKTQGLANLHRCQCVSLCTQCAFQSWADKLVRLARQIQQGKALWRKTQLQLCYAFQTFHIHVKSLCTHFFTVSGDVIKGRSL